MANLQGIGINEQVEEAAAGSTLLPAGWYPMVMVGNDYHANSKNTGMILTCEFQIFEGEYLGETKKDSLNILNPSETAQKIGQGILKKLCRLTGCPFPPADTNLLLGKKLSAKLNIADYTKQDGTKGQCNNIIDYKEYDSKLASQPQTQTQTQPQTQTQGWGV